ncbi:MAG: NifB/NifX family molybdenum-iron cluster-binding protein [Candidatus Hadarchaeia archaeon]
MKIAVSAEGKDLDSQVSSVFGRCQCFVVAEVDEGEIVDSGDLENSAADQSGGAGTAAAQLVGDEGVDVLISGAVGPKAFSALDQWDIEIYKGEPGAVRENIDKFSSGDLEKVESPTGPAHMGMD